MLTKTTKTSLCNICLAITVTAVTGCASRGGICGVDRCADIPAGAIPEPAGVKVCDWQTAQVSNAEADQTVFYKCDFIGNSARIAPDTIQRIARTAGSGLASTQPSIIEPSGDDQLDAARATAVTLQLASYGIKQPTVTVAIPAALGMQGVRAERIADGVGSVGNGTGTFGSAGRRNGAIGLGAVFGNTLSGTTY